MTFTRTTAPLTEWAFGSLTWTDKRGHSVRSAVALQPVATTVPTEVVGTGTSGSKTVSVTPGFTGTLAATVAGLNPATVGTVTVPGRCRHDDVHRPRRHQGAPLRDV